MRKPFTMIEMVVVVLLIALLAAVATPVYFNYLRDARVTAAKTQIELLKQAVLDYSLRMGAVPPQDPGLVALIVNTTDDKRWRPFLSGEEIPPDPWGNAYIYTVHPDGSYEITSYGEDGKQGGEGYAEDLSGRGRSH